MKTVLTLTVLCAALAADVHGQIKWNEPAPPASITISAPPVPIPTGPSVQLAISGLSDADLPGTSVTVVPNSGVSVIPAMGWDKKPMLVFGSTVPGKYTVTVTVHPENEWRLNSTRLLASARDSKMGPELISKYDTFASAFTKELTDKFPFKSGSCVVEVAGPVPFPQPPQPGPSPNPNPNPPPLPPSTKVTRVTYVYEKDQANIPRPVSFGLQRINADSSGSIVATEFEEDTVDGEGEIPDQYKVALEAARKSGLPALVVQSGNVVLRVVKDPKTEQSVLEAIK